MLEHPWFEWVFAHHDLPQKAIAVLLALSGTYVFCERSLRSYRFLYLFFGSRRRAASEWISARCWWPRGRILPLDRARVRAELDIFQPRPSDWTGRRSWTADARTLTKRLDGKLATDKSVWNSYSADDFGKYAPWRHISTPAGLDTNRRRIQAYFEALLKLREGHGSDVSTFLTYVKIDDGYAAPAFLIAGLSTRFESDWKQIIGKYLHTASVVPEFHSPELEELRSFQFNCWLLWGPSIPLCTCEQWDEKRLSEGASRKLVMQYGYGDEANCIDFQIDTPSATSYYSNWLKSIEKKPPGAPRHVGAIPGAIFGQVMWGPLMKPDDLCPAQLPALKGSEHAGAQGGRVVLRFTKRIPTHQPEKTSHYYSAYVWVMFALTDLDGRPLHTEPYRNLLPFFEHGNIADASTLQTIKDNLVAKSLSALSEIFRRKDDARVRIEYVCASDHSGCGSEIRFPPSLPNPDPSNPSLPLRPPLILGLIWEQVMAQPFLGSAAQERRLVLPNSTAAATLEHGKFSSCHLPQIIDQFASASSEAKHP